ncbi:zinc-ribbon and DUF3426 domain-containing protein [Paucibacter sp. APW11]|uniref:Zinc-ribbon and DUF3426 domain-containing protein n=1 Tax=Roseateles aquae TaxID=3077235 RepID=A0ABU3PF45_9BURK|nr:zinc-ribbon and DUF3426 domain-containing protein [Paucibacter sp. APW11]MDT9001158.1 zinc-ribbon and DUF3426 domain-containing protein [Paucibacter sp. APW11]
MSLATRCTACGTIFRVVQDQLRVSDGWVRCGRCAEVFDAREQLFDMDREAPPPWPPRRSGVDENVGQDVDAYAPPPDIVVPPAPASPPARPPAAPRPAPAHSPAPVSHEEADAPLPSWAVSEPGAASARPDPHASFSSEEERREPFFDPPASEPDPRADLPEPRGLRTEPDEPLLPPPDSPDVVLAPGLAAAAQQAAAPEAEPDAQKKRAGKNKSRKPEPKPGFVKRAEGQARWQRPGVRIALSLLGVMLSGALAAQAALHFRDAIAAQYPQARPLLQSMCGLAGCELQPWRRIDAISVDSSALTQASSGNHYKLSLTLRNKSPWELALPAVELSLTDSGGGLITKKALSPQDFKLERNSIAGGAEQPLQIVFSTGSQKVSGYTIEIFHP